MHEIKWYCDECGKEIEQRPHNSFEIKFGNFAGDNRIDLCAICGQKHIDYLNSINKKTANQVDLADGQGNGTYVEKVATQLLDQLKEEAARALTE